MSDAFGQMPGADEQDERDYQAETREMASRLHRGYSVVASELWGVLDELIGEAIAWKTQEFLRKRTEPLEGRGAINALYEFRNTLVDHHQRYIEIMAALKGQEEDDGERE